MRAWPSVDVPALPGGGLPLRLYDTATGEVRPTSPGPTALMYVCGITPYDATHIGHAATYVSFDLVQRVWRDGGHQVRYVQNVTDVDDPLLERARQVGVPWQKIAETETQRFRDDMTALRVLPPDVYLGAVESIPLVSEATTRMRASGVAYALDGDVYFSVREDPGFGSISHLDRASMRVLSAARGGDPDRPGKRDPLDPLLWRARRPGEPFWPSPLGEGRPGWHIECAAIALTHLGPTIDLQGGGRDLVFPHHEFGASHARCLSGQRFARHYVHTAMVGLGGKKMSKSLGNLVFVSKLREGGHDPMAVRLALLAHHYRHDWEWTDAGLAEAEARLARWRAAASRPDGPPADRLLAEVRRLLADDLDAPGALRAVDRWVGEQESRGGSDASAPGIVTRMADALLGVAL